MAALAQTIVILVNKYNCGVNMFFGGEDDEDSFVPSGAGYVITVNHSNVSVAIVNNMGLPVPGAGPGRGT